MNKFLRIVSGLKALLGQKAPSSAVTDTQLNWDNFKPSEEEQAIWEEMVGGEPVTQFRCSTCQKQGNFHWCHNHECSDQVEADPFETCEVCNNDKFVGQNKVTKPFICGGCEEETRYHLGLMKAEKAAMVQSDAMLLRELTLDRLSDAVDALCKGDETYPEVEIEELEECPCSDEGCWKCNPL
jgi:hypothetical protein